MEHRIITLSNGTDKALVSAEDFDRVSRIAWHLHTKGYAQGKVAGKTVYMHRLISGVSRNQQVDHANGDGLDNRRGNLRICNQGQNQANQGVPQNNTTGYKGVHRDKRTGNYQARVSFNGRLRYLGTYKTAEDAARAYNLGARLYHGEFSRPNQVQPAVERGANKWIR